MAIDYNSTIMSDKDCPETLLKSFPLFKELPDDVIARMARHTQIKNFDDGAVIYEFGSPSIDVCFIFEGCAQTLNRSRDGNVIYYDERQAGAYVGMAGAITKKPRSFEVRAKGPVLAGFLDHTFFEEIFTSHQSLAKDICFRLATYVQELTVSSAAQVILPAEGGVALYILKRAKENILEPIPKREPWAAYLGMTRETLSRALSKLGKEGLIAVEKERIIILKPGALEDIARF
jgi:CRP/FNR family transcriptional regulator